MEIIFYFDPPGNFGAIKRFFSYECNFKRILKMTFAAIILLLLVLLFAILVNFLQFTQNNP